MKGVQSMYVSDCNFTGLQNADCVSLSFNQFHEFYSLSGICEQLPFIVWSEDEYLSQIMIDIYIYLAF